MKRRAFFKSLVAAAIAPKMDFDGILAAIEQNRRTTVVKPYRGTICVTTTMPMFPCACGRWNPAWMTLGWYDFKTEERFESDYRCDCGRKVVASFDPV